MEVPSCVKKCIRRICSSIVFEEIRVSVTVLIELVWHNNSLGFVVKATIYLQRMTLSRQPYILRVWCCQGNHISSEDDVVKATIYRQRMALSRQPYIFRGWRCQANYISSEDGVVKATIYRQRMTLWQGIPYTLNCLASCERWPHTTMRDSLFY